MEGFEKDILKEIFEVSTDDEGSYERNLKELAEITQEIGFDIFELQRFIEMQSAVSPVFQFSPTLVILWLNVISF